MSEQKIPVQIYFRVFGLLMVLTLVTVGVAFIDLGWMNNFIALSIAVAKALVVVLYFMHVRYSQRLVPVFLGAGVFWLLLLLVLTFGDYTTREPGIVRDLVPATTAEATSPLLETSLP